MGHKTKMKGTKINGPMCLHTLAKLTQNYYPKTADTTNAVGRKFNILLPKEHLTTTFHSH